MTIADPNYTPAEEPVQPEPVVAEPSHVVVDEAPSPGPVATPSTVAAYTAPAEPTLTPGEPCPTCGQTVPEPAPYIGTTEGLIGTIENPPTLEHQYASREGSPQPPPAVVEAVAPAEAPVAPQEAPVASEPVIAGPAPEEAPVAAEEAPAQETWVERVGDVFHRDDQNGQTA